MVGLLAAACFDSASSTVLTATHSLLNSATIQLVLASSCLYEGRPLIGHLALGPAVVLVLGDANGAARP